MIFPALLSFISDIDAGWNKFLKHLSGCNSLRYISDEDAEYFTNKLFSDFIA